MISNTKICTKCNRPLPETEEYFYKRNENSFKSICKECYKKARETYYNTHKNKRLEYAKEYNKRSRTIAIEFITNLKKESKCAYCSEDDYRVLDFHHTGPKKHGISEMMHNGYSVKLLKRELKNCVIVCSNCRRKIHSTEPAPINEKEDN